MGRNSNKKRKKKNDGGKNMLYIALGVIAVAVVAVFLLIPGKKKIHYIDDEVGEVRQVINGNTIQLKNGLKVQLLGIAPSSKSKKFLSDNLLNQQVRLKADGSNLNPYYTNAEKETVSAYVNMLAPSSFANVNGYMILNQQAGFKNEYCRDSADVFGDYYVPDPVPDPNPGPGPGPDILLSEIELGKKMTKSTFLIQGNFGENGTSIGTGFYINDKGLALTNYHVLRYDAKYYTIFISDEEGHVTIDRDRKIRRKITWDKDLDYCIFYVDLDPGETTPYLDLAREQPERGTKVGVVGNPVTDSGLFTATYTTGQISALRENMIQFDASITHGNSGGPVCDYYGRVLGITKAVAVSNGQQNAANLNFAVDIQKVREVLDQLKDVDSYGGK